MPFMPSPNPKVRKLAWVVLGVVISGVISCHHPPKTKVPDQLIEQPGEDPNLSSLEAAWIRILWNHLERLEEDPVVVQSRASESYRVWWTGFMMSAWCVHVELHGSSGVLQAKRRITVEGYADTATGYSATSPDSAVESKSRNLTTDEVRELRRRFTAAAFWELDSWDAHSGYDGSWVTVEGKRAGRYHVVYRWSPRNSDFADLVHIMQELPR